MEKSAIPKNAVTIVKSAQVLSIREYVSALLLSTACLGAPASGAAIEFKATLPGTQPLTIGGDIASNLVAGVDRFLLKEIERAEANRSKFWNRDGASAESFDKSIQTNRARLAHILGMRDERVKVGGFEVISDSRRGGRIATGKGFSVTEIRWKALDGITAEGLMLTPLESGNHPDVVAIPDADVAPESLVGLSNGLAASSQFARLLAESGCRVLIPTLINRHVGDAKAKGHNRGSGLSNREFIYRSAFELGRHLIGYEVQKVLAAVDRFSQENGSRAKIGVVGWGEGGSIALYAGALDPRITATCVSGYFTSRSTIWEQPIDRNVFGLLEQFGDAELASMVAPRCLVVEAARAPNLELKGTGGGAPALLRTPELANVKMEFARAQRLLPLPWLGGKFHFVTSGDGNGPELTAGTLKVFLSELGVATEPRETEPQFTVTREIPDAKIRNLNQMVEMDRFTQRVLTESPYTRQEFLKKLDTSSLPKYEETARGYRDFFYEEVIGKFSTSLLPPNARSRKVYDEDKWVGYEVVLDVFEDVIAYGLLLLPKDLKEGEKRPVVVCQHGLEGRPQDTIGKEGFQAYSAFSAKLAERGFITFAPQNLYIFKDRFRTLQRKANPIKKTLFSVITPQHQQIIQWLKTQPFVDGERIAFYGLSYGGKTAMRVPAILTDYCLSICSADFNEWVWKNASTRSPYSYVWSGEYEIFEFDLGSTFNYAEMAALIAPRPFMVERGHFDGVAPDETVGYEFAKVRFLYAAKLGLGERAELEWFVGPHTINGKGTYEFLHKHLAWPKR